VASVGDNAERLNRTLAEVGLIKTDYGGLGASFETQHGRLEIVRRADGVGRYDDWMRNATNVEFEHLTIVVAATEDIVKSKEASGREKDRTALPGMRRDFGLAN
jgi:hypothetical protein